MKVWKELYVQVLLWIGIIVFSLRFSRVNEHDKDSGRDHLSTSPSGSKEKAPLKVFVMVGQSNMEGHGYIDKTEDDNDTKFLNGTLEWMVETFPETYGKLKTYEESGSSSWKQRKDVFITYNQQRTEHVRPEWNHLGLLAPGYGDGNPNSLQMGPELAFGWTVGDALAETTAGSDEDESPSILLLKVAWGGRSLAVNYRPPSAGGVTGLFYEAMLANVYKTLANLEHLVPGYTVQQGYEILGFAWHQGWNDGCNDTMTDEYESNLAHLIRDIRIDLGVPDLPVAIGVSGMNGWDQPPGSTRTKIAEAQLAVANAAKYPEFAGTVATVETRDFFRTVDNSPGNQIYHWNNNCESYWLIGQAMGKAMIKLLRKKEKKEKTLDNDDRKRVNEELSVLRTRMNAVLAQEEQE